MNTCQTIKNRSDKITCLQVVLQQKHPTTLKCDCRKNHFIVKRVIFLEDVLHRTGKPHKISTLHFIVSSRRSK